MSRIDEIVRLIAVIPGSRVDHGYGQGIEAVRQQFELLLGESVSNSYLEEGFRNFHEFLTNLESWIAPYNLPNDYAIFLKQYGGLTIHSGTFTFSLFGFGPMCHEWYPYLIGDDALADPSQDGLLQIGSIHFDIPEKDFPYALFFIDLSGRMKQNSIVRIGPVTTEEFSIHDISLNPLAHVSMWNIEADSFLDWLAIVVNTAGKAVSY